MDLPTCPACGQSVLDEDVDDCPFCGASMSAKPSRKPGSQKQPASRPAASPTGAPKSSTGAPKSPRQQDSATATKQPPHKAGQKTATMASATTSVDVDDKDDPFYVDPSQAKKAIPLAPKRFKNRTYKVVCPMCETVGFVPPKAAGRDVRCVNPECLVPVFTAPLLHTTRVVEEDESPPSKSLSPMLKFSIAAGVLIVATIVGVVILIPRDDSTGKKKPKKGSRGPGGQIRSDNPGINPNPEDNPPVQSHETAVRLTTAQLCDKLLAYMIERSLDPIGNRSKPYCRRQTAIAFAVCGQIAKAHGQREALDGVGGYGVPFYHVPPLVEIAWKQIEADDLDAAKKTVDQAWNYGNSLPHTARDHLDFASQLAAVLVAVGRQGDARRLLKDHHDAGTLGQLSAQWRYVHDFQTFDIEASVTQGPLFAWSDPQSVAVTNALAARGHWDQALAWAEGNSKPAGRIECVVAWAVARATQATGGDNTDEWQHMRTIADRLPPAGQARLWARAAQRRIAADDKETAAQFLKTANEAIESVNVPPPVRLQGLKEIYKFDCSSAEPFQMAAAAAAEIARGEALLDQSKEAWRSVSRAMGYLRGSAPSLPLVYFRLDEISDLGQQVVGNRLKTAFNGGPGFNKNGMYFKYRRKCRGEVREAAEVRFQLQSRLLKHAAGWGLRENIWKEIQARADKSENRHRREPYFATALPQVLAARYRDAGEPDQADKIESLRTGGDNRNRIRFKAEQESSRLIAAGKHLDAATFLNARRFRDDDVKVWRHRWSMRLAVRLMNQGELVKAYEFATSSDTILSEYMVELISARAAIKGLGEETSNLIHTISSAPTEAVAAARGCIAGILAYEKTQPSQPKEADLPTDSQ